MAAEMMLIDSCRYSLSDSQGKETASGEASVQLEEQAISITPKFSEAIYLSLIDIIDLASANYRVTMKLGSEESVSIFDLGYKFEDFARTLFSLRSEMVLKHLLMSEPVKKSRVQAELVFEDSAGGERRTMAAGSCEPRLYETSLTVIPAAGDPVRIPYSDILRVEEKEYALEITTEFGEKITLSRMGTEFDDFKKTLSDSMNALALKVQSTLKELFPALDPSVARKAARLMKEGRAAKRSDLESVSPELWKSLEGMIGGTGIKKEYEYLKSLSQPERVCIGLKRGLVGDLSGDYLWFLFPIYSSSTGEPGNAIAMEVASLRPRNDGGILLQDGERLDNAMAGADSPAKSQQAQKSGGAATYFFRMAPRGGYPRLAGNLADLHSRADSMILKLNRLMQDINFRREPIYLPEDRLKEAQYRKYVYAVKKIPSLKTLRELFIGRVTHSSFEQWQSDVNDLLRFNASVADDSARWSRA